MVYAVEEPEGRFVYGFEEFRALMRARRQRSGSSLLRRLLVVALLFLAVTVGLGIYEGWLTSTSLFQGPLLQSPIGAMLMALAALMAFVVAVDMVFDRLIYRLVFRRYAHANSEIRLRLTGAGIEWSARGMRGVIDYAAIEDVTFLDDKSGAVAWISKVEGFLLPVRAFSPERGYHVAVKKIVDRLAKP